VYLTGVFLFSFFFFLFQIGWKCFFWFCNCHLKIHISLKKTARFLYWVLACNKKCKGCLNYFTFISFLLSNFAILSCECSSLQLYHKKEKRKTPTSINLLLLNKWTIVKSINTTYPPKSHHACCQELYNDTWNDPMHTCPPTHIGLST
jgi:hypothetical protein